MSFCKLIPPLRTEYWRYVSTLLILLLDISRGATEIRYYFPGHLLWVWRGPGGKGGDSSFTRYGIDPLIKWIKCNHLILSPLLLSCHGEGLIGLLFKPRQFPRKKRWGNLKEDEGFKPASLRGEGCLPVYGKQVDRLDGWIYSSGSPMNVNWSNDSSEEFGKLWRSLEYFVSSLV